MPEKIVLNKDVYRVVLFFFLKTLTVIEKRAPTLLPLDMGVMQILDANNNVAEEFFVADGAVDIKNDTCTILTECALDQADMSLEKAQELNNEFHNYFFDWVLQYYQEMEKYKK